MHPVAHEVAALVDRAVTEHEHLLREAANRVVDVCYGKPGEETEEWKGLSTLGKRGLLDAVYALATILGRVK